jgi:hypothetical protein
MPEEIEKDHLCFRLQVRFPDGEISHVTHAHIPFPEEGDDPARLPCGFIEFMNLAAEELGVFEENQRAVLKTEPYNDPKNN